MNKLNAEQTVLHVHIMYNVMLSPTHYNTHNVHAHMYNTHTHTHTHTQHTHTHAHTHTHMYICATPYTVSNNNNTIDATSPSDVAPHSEENKTGGESADTKDPKVSVLEDGGANTEMNEYA